MDGFRYMAPYSLTQRCKMLRRKYGGGFRSPYYLYKFYKGLGIRYKKVRIVKARSGKQRNFSLEERDRTMLADLKREYKSAHDEGREIILIDESTFTSKTYKQ